MRSIALHVNLYDPWFEMSHDDHGAHEDLYPIFRTPIGPSWDEHVRSKDFRALHSPIHREVSLASPDFPFTARNDQ